jgi:hypothetical protein
MTQAAPAFTGAAAPRAQAALGAGFVGAVGWAIAMI